MVGHEDRQEGEEPMSHAIRRDEMKRFTKGLRQMAVGREDTVVIFCVVFTANGRAESYMTPSMIADANVVVAEVGRHLNAFGLHRGLTPGQIAGVAVGIAKLEDGTMEGRA